MFEQSKKVRTQQKMRTYKYFKSLILHYIYVYIMLYDQRFYLFNESSNLNCHQVN